MSLYPDTNRCPVCDLLMSGAWNENARCKCDDDREVAEHQEKSNERS